MTEAGEKYFHHCARDSRSRVGKLRFIGKRKPFGVLKVSAPVDFGRAVLPRIVKAYTTKYPDVSVELVVTNRIVDVVEEGVDLAIRWAGSIKNSSLIARRFIETRSALGFTGVPENVRQSYTSTRAGQCRIPGPSRTEDGILTNGKSDFELQLNGRVGSDDLEVITELIVLGDGIAWLPDFWSRTQ